MEILFVLAQLEAATVNEQLWSKMQFANWATFIALLSTTLTAIICS